MEPASPARIRSGCTRSHPASGASAPSRPRTGTSSPRSWNTISPDARSMAAAGARSRRATPTSGAAFRAPAERNSSRVSTGRSGPSTISAGAPAVASPGMASSPSAAPSRIRATAPSPSIVAPESSRILRRGRGRGLTTISSTPSTWSTRRPNRRAPISMTSTWPSLGGSPRPRLVDSEMIGSRVSLSRNSIAPWMFSMLRDRAGPTRTTSETPAWGAAKRWPSTTTISVEMMARVRGMRIEIAVPAPGVETRST